MPAFDDGSGRRDRISVESRVFLYQHRIGAVRHRRAGEDADRLAAVQRVGKAVARGAFADQF